jgi:hypothetical protein
MQGRKKWIFVSVGNITLEPKYPSSNLLTRWPIRASEALLYIMYICYSVATFSSHVLLFWKNHTILFGKPDQSCPVCYEAQFRYVQFRSFFSFFGSEAHFGFLLQGLVQPRPSSDCFWEAFEPILSIGCIRRGFLWTSKTVFWALRNQWTLVLRCAFRKSPSELYKITVLCLLVLPTLTKWR